MCVQALHRGAQLTFPDIPYMSCKSLAVVLTEALACCMTLGGSPNLLGSHDLICKRRVVDNLKLLL